MKNKILRIVNNGIYANTLKIIAVIAMVIDHIAFYNSNILPANLVVIMRSIGRIAMPIFVYLLVQGFFNTKNYKNYLTRISVFAVVTQVMFWVLGFVNKTYFPSYVTNVYYYGNILISFALTLILLKVIHEPQVLKRYTVEQNIIVKVIIALVILSIYTFIPFDSGINVPILATLFYCIERFRITVLMSRVNTTFTIKNYLMKSVDEITIKRVYLLLLLLALVICAVFVTLNWYGVLAIVPLYLYNGERKKRLRKYNYIYYAFFPLHHALIYIIAMCH